MYEHGLMRMSLIYDIITLRNVIKKTFKTQFNKITRTIEQLLL